MKEKPKKSGEIEAESGTEMSAEDAGAIVAEEDTSDIGVFICNCGINIAGVVDVPQVTEFSKTLPGVKYAELNLSYCTEAGAVAIQKAIDEQKLKRIVIAACTPKTHLPVFQSVLKAANLPKRMLEFVNLREHDAFIHMQEKDAATEKAKALIAAAVERAKNLEDVPTEIVDVTRKALVIGGGVAGLQSALDLAKLEYDVTVVEKTPTTGGKMAKLDRTFPTDDCSI